LAAYPITKPFIGADIFGQTFANYLITLTTGR
jgi:hypothetical protein